MISPGDSVVSGQRSEKQKHVKDNGRRETSKDGEMEHPERRGGAIRGPASHGGVAWGLCHCPEPGGGEE